MDYGIQYTPDHPETLAEHAKLAESVGFDLFGVADSQSLFRELYTSLAHVANATDTIRTGSTVTNPVTRHPAVAASAIATVDEIAGGRTWFGMATGDSAVHTIGEAPASLAETEAALERIGDLLAGRPVEYHGNEFALEYAEADGYDIPRFLAAEGPRTLEAAGRVADGVLVGTGLQPELVRESIESIATGARQAGRNPAELTIWLFAKSNVGETREAAIDEIKMALAGSANHAFRYTLEGKHVPDEYHDPIRTLMDEYRSEEHEKLGETRNRQLVEELELTDYLADRFAVAGTPEDCAAKLSELADVEGVDGVLLTAFTEDEAGLIEDMGAVLDQV